jgi:hypothetical protein
MTTRVVLTGRQRVPCEGRVGGDAWGRFGVSSERAYSVDRFWAWGNAARSSTCEASGC